MKIKSQDVTGSSEPKNERVKGKKNKNLRRGFQTLYNEKRERRESRKKKKKSNKGK